MPPLATTMVVVAVPNVVGLYVTVPLAVGGAGPAAAPYAAVPAGAAAAVGAAEITTAKTVDRTIKATTNMLKALFCLLLAFMVFVWGSPARSQSSRWSGEQSTKYKKVVKEETWASRAREGPRPPWVVVSRRISPLRYSPPPAVRESGGTRRPLPPGANMGAASRRSLIRGSASIDGASVSGPNLTFTQEGRR